MSKLFALTPLTTFIVLLCVLTKLTKRRYDMMMMMMMMTMMASDDCVIESITELSQKWRVGPILIATHIVSPVERLGTELETQLLGITAVLGDR